MARTAADASKTSAASSASTATTKSSEATAAAATATTKSTEVTASAATVASTAAQILSVSDEILSSVAVAANSANTVSAAIATAQAARDAATVNADVFASTALAITRVVSALTIGAAEANPLGPVGVVVAKVVLHQYIKALPAVEQPQAWRVFGAVGWGAAANNLCVVITIATGGSGAVLCPVIGVSTGVGVFVSTAEAARRETFDAVCADAQIETPELLCAYEPEVDYSP